MQKFLIIVIVVIIFLGVESAPNPEPSWASIKKATPRVVGTALAYVGLDAAADSVLGKNQVTKTEIIRTPAPTPKESELDKTLDKTVITSESGQTGTYVIGGVSSGVFLILFGVIIYMLKRQGAPPELPPVIYTARANIPMAPTPRRTQ